MAFMPGIVTWRINVVWSVVGPTVTVDVDLIVVVARTNCSISSGCILCHWKTLTRSNKLRRCIVNIDGDAANGNNLVDEVELQYD